MNPVNADSEFPTLNAPPSQPKSSIEESKDGIDGVGQQKRIEQNDAA